MLPPQPFKFVCLKCGYIKIVKPKSDVVNPIDMINTCPKCGAKMEKKELNSFDVIKSFLR